MIEVLKNVIAEHPGWTMFCIVMLVLAVASRIEGGKVE